MLLKGMPELTVCIFQDSSSELFRRAIGSVLEQQGVDFEVRVIASADIELPADPRISVLPKTSRRAGRRP